MLRHILQIPYMKDLVKRLRRDPCLRRMCGYGDRAPCEAHFSQMKHRIGPEGFRMMEVHLRHEVLRIREGQPLAAVGLIHAASLDATDLQLGVAGIPMTHGKAWVTLKPEWAEARRAST